VQKWPLGLARLLAWGLVEKEWLDSRPAEQGYSAHLAI
jgi:hypothetical protein